MKRYKYTTTNKNKYLFNLKDMSYGSIIIANKDLSMDLIELDKNIAIELNKEYIKEIENNNVYTSYDTLNAKYRNINTEDINNNNTKLEEIKLNYYNQAINSNPSRLNIIVEII